MPQSGLYDAAAGLLAVCETLLAATPGGTPSRSYVSPGAPALDCELLTVHAGALSEDTTAPNSPPPQQRTRFSKAGRVNLATLVVTIVRCAPATTTRGNPTSAVELDADAQAVSADAWALWNGVPRSAWWSECSGGYVDNAIALPMQGNYAGWVLQFRVPVNGYAP